MGTSAASSRSPVRFFLLVFALSLPFWLVGAIVERRGFQPGLPMNLPVSSLMAVCPLVAAVVLVYRAEGSAGVKRLLRRVLDYRRIGRRRWYLAIVLLNPAILVGAYGVMRLLGRPLPDPHVSLVTAPLLLLVFVPPAVGEEAGWTGYAIDPLQGRWGALRASLLGSVEAIGHVVPLIQAHHGPAWIAWKGLETLAARVLIVWLYNNTGKSLFAAVLFHALSNVSVALFPNAGSHYDPAVAATSGAGPAEAGLASGLINTSQQLGGALGIAALVAVATARTASVLEDGADRLVALTEGFRAGFAGGALVVAAAAALAALLLSSTTSRRHASRSSTGGLVRSTR